MLKATVDIRRNTTMVVRILFAACIAFAAGAAFAEEPPALEAPPPDPVRVRLLDEVPNYPAILKEQWSTTVRPSSFEREATHYGLLNDVSAPRPITLEESVALALQNNTGLRIQMLNPIAATARVR